MGCKSVETTLLAMLMLVIGGCGNKVDTKSERNFVPLTAEQQIAKIKLTAREPQCSKCTG